MDDLNAMTIVAVEGLEIGLLHLLPDLVEGAIGPLNDMVDNQGSDPQLIGIEIPDDSLGLFHSQSLGYGHQEKGRSQL